MNANSAILVYIQDAIATHRVCTVEEATAELDEFRQQGLPATMFVADGFDVRDRIEDAKAKIRASARLIQALNRNDVPPDITLRCKILRAFAELNACAVPAVLAA